MRTDKDQPTLTEADAKADLADTLRPDNPSTEGLRWAAEQAGTAPKVTPTDIEAEIASEHYFTAADGVNGASSSMPISSGPLHLLTFCVLVLRNGFTVTGESACASPANFDAEVGRKVARQAAVAKCWPLMGFALRNELTGHRQMITTPVLDTSKLPAGYLDNDRQQDA